VPLWAGGFAAELRDDAAGLRAVRRRVDKNPLGSAAGYGVPRLPIDREATRAALGFAEVHTPVTAVQLSRGKAEAQLLFEIALLMGDLGRLASDLVLWNSEEFGFVEPARGAHHRLVDHAAEAQPGRLRARARSDRDRPGLSLRGAGDHRQAAYRAITGICSCSRRRSSAASTSRGGHARRARRELCRSSPSGPSASLSRRISYAAERAYALVLEHGIRFREGLPARAAELAKS
jgi:hypothetical protein